MRCERCKIFMEERSNQRYRYVESGLDNVYLEGINVFLCPHCEVEIPKIPRITELHDLIGRALAAKPAPLTAPEIRFLRKNLGMSARKWAEWLSVDPATLSRWEAGDQKWSESLELLIRLLYMRLREEKEGQHYPDKIVGDPTTGMAEPLAVILHENSRVYRYEHLTA